MVSKLSVFGKQIIDIIAQKRLESLKIILTLLAAHIIISLKNIYDTIKGRAADMATKADMEKQIKGLEEQLRKYQEWMMESEGKYNQLLEQKELQFQELPIYLQMKREIEFLEAERKMHKSTVRKRDERESALRGKIQELLKENEGLKESIKSINDTVGGTKKAGRKPKSEEAIQGQLKELVTLLDEGKKEQEICAAMKVSRATYFRLKRMLKEKEVSKNK